MTFDRSWVLFLAWLPLAWATFEWKRTSRRFGLAMKALCFVAVIVALAEPLITLPESKLAVAVLVDTSASQRRFFFLFHDEPLPLEHLLVFPLLRSRQVSS